MLVQKPSMGWEAVTDYGIPAAAAALWGPRVLVTGTPPTAQPRAPSKRFPREVPLPRVTAARPPAEWMLRRSAAHQTPSGTSAVWCVGRQGSRQGLTGAEERVGETGRRARQGAAEGCLPWGLAPCSAGGVRWVNVC